MQLSRLPFYDESEDNEDDVAAGRGDDDGPSSGIDDDDSGGGKKVQRLRKKAKTAALPPCPNKTQGAGIRMKRKAAAADDDDEDEMMAGGGRDGKNNNKSGGERQLSKLKHPGTEGEGDGAQQAARRAALQEIASRKERAAENMRLRLAAFADDEQEDDVGAAMEGIKRRRIAVAKTMDKGKENDGDAGEEMVDLEDF